MDIVYDWKVLWGVYKYTFKPFVLLRYFVGIGGT